MKSAWFFPLLACAGVCLAPMTTPAEVEAPPSWVVAEKEPLVLKKPAPPSYLEVEQTATILRPKALTRADDLEKLNPGLLAVLPGLRELIAGASVSPKFKQLYDAKIALAAEGTPLSAHSYFDCATALDLKDSKSGRGVFLFQSDMDTDTDGTDPVRLPKLQDYDDARMSRSFQPLLSYSWNKGAVPAVNPFPKYYEDTLAQLRKLQGQVDALAQADPGPVWREVRKHFEEQVGALDRRAKYYHNDLMSRRSLVGSLDPFMVVPQNWVDAKTRVGDLAAVIYQGRVFPCLIGDTGPTAKTGEGSQRLAQALNPKASGRNSAATTPEVTYLVFPGTRWAMTEPDPTRLRAEVSKLIGEIGGLGSGVSLHAWK